jgi:hypothetical protein
VARIFPVQQAVSAPPGEGEHIDVAIAELAARQHGIVARRQLVAMGASSAVIEHRLGVARLHRIHAGVYSVGHRLLRPHGRYLAAVLACCEGAVLSHRSAADLWGMRPTSSARIDVTIRRGGTRARESVIVHTTRSLPAEDVAASDGIPCTSVARSLVDLAAVVSRTQLRRALVRSLELDIFDRGAVDEVLSRSNGRRGVRMLRRVLAGLPDTSPPVRSELERRFLEIVREAGIPPPVVNARIAGHEVDFHWPAQRLVVETDGRATHDTATAFEHDRARDLDLHLAGWQVVRLTWSQVTREPYRVAALLRARARSASSGVSE